MDSSILELLLDETEDEKYIIHTINRESHAFVCNFGDTLHSERAKNALAILVQLLSPAARAIIPKLHSKACDSLYKSPVCFGGEVGGWKWWVGE